MLRKPYFCNEFQRFWAILNNFGVPGGHDFGDHFGLMLGSFSGPFLGSLFLAIFGPLLAKFWGQFWDQTGPRRRQDEPERAIESFKDPKACICKNLKKPVGF